LGNLQALIVERVVFFKFAEAAAARRAFENAFQRQRVSVSGLRRNVESAKEVGSLGAGNSVNGMSPHFSTAGADMVTKAL
jgi:hypothetical protein